MKKSTRTFLIVILFLSALVIRLYLFTHQANLYDSADDLIGAMMAKNILDKNEHVFFQYGHSFSGANVVQAYGLSMVLIFTGLSIAAIKINALLFSMITLLLAYLFVKRFFGKNISLIFLILALIPFPIYTRTTSGVGFHYSAILFDLLIVIIFFSIFFRKDEIKKTKRNMLFILFGLVSAASYWALETAIIPLATCIIFWFIFDKKFFVKKEFLYYISALFVGFIPLIWFNLTHNFSNFKHLFAESFIHSLVCKYNLLQGIAYCMDPVIKTNSNLFDFFGKNLPGFFGVGISSYILYGVFISALFYLIMINRKNIKNLAKKILNLRIKDIPQENIKKEFFIITLILLFILSYYLKGMEKIRLLLPIYIYSIILIAIFLHAVLSKKGLAKKLI